MSYISKKFRDEIRDLANGRCEYCLLSELYTEYTHEIDHIHPEKHHGVTELHNLCLCCVDCNSFKGPNLCSIDLETQELASLFNPRSQQWADHFELQRGIIHPLTGIGRVTVRILEINTKDRINVRAALTDLGFYPNPEPIL